MCCDCGHCGGCGCGALCSECASQIVYAFERFAQCCAMAGVITCFLLTYVVTLGIGVGLGYNYCFVDFKANPSQGAQKEVPDARFRRLGVADTLENPVWPEVRAATRKTVTEEYPLMATMVVPVWSRANLTMLLQKIRGSKKNITLEILST